MEDVDYMETEDKIKIGIIATIIIIVVATIIAGSIISPKPSHSVKEDKIKSRLKELNLNKNIIDCRKRVSLYSETINNYVKNKCINIK